MSTDWLVLQREKKNTKCQLHNSRVKRNKTKFHTYIPYLIALIFIKNMLEIYYRRRGGELLAYGLFVV